MNAVTAPGPRRPPSPAALRRFAAGVGIAACAASAGCRGGGGFLAAKPASDPFAAAVASADGFGGPAVADDDGSAVVKLSDPGLGGGGVRTASLETPARPAPGVAGVTRVNPFAAPTPAAPTGGGWLPGDGSDDPPAAIAAVPPAAADSPATAFAASDSPAAAAPAEPVDWAAELEAFAGPAAPADPPAAVPPVPVAPTVDPFAPAAAVAVPAKVVATPVAVSSEPPAAPRFDPGDLPPAPLWDAGDEDAPPAATPAPRPAALGSGTPQTAADRRGDGWHSRRPTDVDPFAP